MPTVVGGKLKLKGDKPKRNTKKREREEVKEEKTVESFDAHLTESQRKHLRKQQEAEERQFKKQGLKTYRQRVEELNQHLAQLTEHNDIPRVSAAGNG